MEAALDRSDCVNRLQLGAQKSVQRIAGIGVTEEIMERMLGPCALLVNGTRMHRTGVHRETTQT